MYKILITTVGGLTSPSVISAVRELGNTYIVGVDPFELAVGRFFVDKFYKVTYSFDNEIKFIDELCDIIKKEEIDILVPCGNEDNLTIAKFINKFGNIKVLVNDYETLIKAFDKGLVYKNLKRYVPEAAPNFYIVKTYEEFLDALNFLGYPRKRIVIKPRLGRGGRGVYVLSEKLSFEKVFSSKPNLEYPQEFFDKVLKDTDVFPELIVMEYLSEPIYSIYSLCLEGNTIIAMTHIREWGNASQTFRGTVYYDKKLEEIASKINKIFNLSFNINMEFATSNDGRIVLFDLNPRVAASSAIDRKIGLNFITLSIKTLLGEKIKIDKDKFKNKKRFIRYFEERWL